MLRDRVRLAAAAGNAIGQRKVRPEHAEDGYAAATGIRSQQV